MGFQIYKVCKELKINLNSKCKKFGIHFIVGIVIEFEIDVTKSHTSAKCFFSIIEINKYSQTLNKTNGNAKTKMSLAKAGSREMKREKEEEIRW